MARFKARKVAKKVVRKGKSPFTSYTRTKQLIKLINKVSLKKAETKNTLNIVEDNQLYHNVQTLRNNLLFTSTGITDNQDTTSSYASRIGDSVVARGLSIKLWIANKLDRPNVMYRLIVYRYYGAAPSNIFYSQGSTNMMLRDVDTEKYKVLYAKRINLQVGYSATAQITAQSGGNNYNAQKEAHKYVKIWIPMKNKIITYQNGVGNPMKGDIGFCIVPYDSYGTLTTDNISSYAFNYKFYFKDP